MQPATAIVCMSFVRVAEITGGERSRGWLYLRRDLYYTICNCSFCGENLLPLRIKHKERSRNTDCSKVSLYFYWLSVNLHLSKLGRTFWHSAEYLNLIQMTGTTLCQLVIADLRINIYSSNDGKQLNIFYYYHVHEAQIYRDCGCIQVQSEWS